MALSAAGSSPERPDRSAGPQSAAASNVSENDACSSSAQLRRSEPQLNGPVRIIGFKHCNQFRVEEKTSPPSAPKKKKTYSLSPPVGCRHFKQATCSWPALLSRSAAREGTASPRLAQVWERRNTCVNVYHKSTLTSLCRSSVYAAQAVKSLQYELSGARS